MVTKQEILIFGGSFLVIPGGNDFLNTPLHFYIIYRCNVIIVNLKFISGVREHIYMCGPTSLKCGEV